MLVTDKAALRQQLRQHCAKLDIRESYDAALIATEHLARTPWLRQAQHVAAYLDFGNELPTSPLIEFLLAAGKQVYVPKISSNHRMRFLRLDAGTALRQNEHGISEPAGRAMQRSLRQMDVVILPLLGFDLRGYRLGTGGGYYDRALAFPRVFRKPLLIGYAHAAQQIEKIPAEPWDIQLDAVVTENGILKFAR